MNEATALNDVVDALDGLGVVDVLQRWYGHLPNQFVMELVRIELLIVRL